MKLYPIYSTHFPQLSGMLKKKIKKKLKGYKIIPSPSTHFGETETKNTISALHPP